MSSVGEELPKEMTRVRDVVLPEYLALPMGIFAATAMRADLDAAARALAQGDVIAIIRAYEALKGWEL